MIHIHDPEYFIICDFPHDDVEGTISLVAITTLADKINPGIEIIAEVLECKSLRIILHIVYV